MKLPFNVKYKYIEFFKMIELTDKKKEFFIGLGTLSAQLGFMVRVLVKIAYMVEIPKPYINQFNYKRTKTQDEMQSETMLLLSVVIHEIKKRNNRETKINTIFND